MKRFVIILLFISLIFVGCETGNETLFSVTFNTNGGTPVPQNQIKTKGEKVTEPQGVTMDGCTLDGWYTESSFLNKWDFETDTFTADITLHAKWLYNCPNGISTVTPDDSALVPISKADQLWLDKHNDKKNNVVKNQKIIFIGDSITRGFEDFDTWTKIKIKYNDKITNLGFSGDFTQHVIWRLENGEFPVGINPEFVVLLIGINNVYNNYHTESIAAGIGKICNIINQNSPVTKIILLSILPCGIGNNDINTINSYAVNEIIKKYNGHKNIEYVDIGQYYIDNNGILKDELFGNDKLHLNKSGYDFLSEKLIEIIQ